LKNDRPVIGISMNYALVDKYEQFHIRNTYIDAVFTNGGLPLPLPCTADQALVEHYLSKVQALLIIGGLDYPPHLWGENPHPEIKQMHDRRWQGDITLFLQAFHKGLPILGICAGCQLINIGLGGKIIQHISNSSMHTGDSHHPIKITGGRWLPKIFTDSQIMVNSTHHQALDPNKLGRGIEAVAFAPDGVVEAIEADTPQMVLGLQWHPERVQDERHRAAVFGKLCEEAHKIELE